MRTSTGVALGVAVGAGIAAAARRATERSDEFYACNRERQVLSGPGFEPITLPLTYHRTEQVVSVHPAAFEPIRAALPTDALHPVRLPDGRALLAVSAARYLEGTAEGADPQEMPYGETMIAVIVTTKPSPALLPLVRQLLPGSGRPPYGGFLLHMAVTKRAWRDMGRALGYPVFTADFAFEDDLDERRVRVSDEGREVFRLAVAARGRISADRRPMAMYNVRGDELLETVTPCSGYAQQAVGRGSGRLELGDHPVADDLRALQPSATPLVTRCYLNLRILVPPSRVAGKARPYAGYAGTDRPVGAYSIRYPDGSAIDLGATTP